MRWRASVQNLAGNAMDRAVLAGPGPEGHLAPKMPTSGKWPFEIHGLILGPALRSPVPDKPPAPWSKPTKGLNNILARYGARSVVTSCESSTSIHPNN
jgi:hypothetical protein